MLCVQQCADGLLVKERQTSLFLHETESVMGKMSRSSTIGERQGLEKYIVGVIRLVREEFLRN